MTINIMNKTADNIINQACIIFSIKREDIFSIKRRENISDVKHAILYVLYKILLYGDLKTCASVLNKKNHSSVCFSVKAIEAIFYMYERYGINEDLYKKIKKLITYAQTI